MLDITPAEEYTLVMVIETNRQQRKAESQRKQGGFVMGQIDSNELALVQECKLEGDRGLAALLLQTARRREQNRRLVERLMSENGGSAEGIELSNAPKGRTKEPSYVAILPEPDGSGRGRLVSFRDNGFHGHQVYANAETALVEAIRDGYRWQVQVLDQLAVRPSFQKGQRFVDLIFAYNTGKIDAEAFRAEVESLDRLYGVKDAFNPLPWVIVTNPGTDDEDIWADYSTHCEAVAALADAEEGADVMKRLDDGTLTTEF